MAHSRSHSQPVQYRYRPNAPARAFTAVPSKPIQDSPSTRSQLMHSPPYEIPLAQSYMQTTAETDAAYGMAFSSGFAPIDQTNLAFTNGLQPIDFPAQLSPSASPWISSNSSVNSDTGSAAWSSPASNMGFSPEPQYQIPYTGSTSWPSQDYNPCFSGHCVSMQEVLPATETEFTAPIFYPQMPQQWQYPFMDNGLMSAYDSSDYCSSHGSPESISDQASRSTETVATVKPRSDSILTDSSVSSSSSTFSKDTTPASPQRQSRVKPRFQGQLLEFSTPLAQVKSKGFKSAALPCPLAAYGCTSSFISKNEWKRHINTQHLRLEAWLCDQCPKRDNKREFNRKDLFIQHLKRMHPTPCPTHTVKSQSVKAKPTRKGDKAGKASKGDDLDPALLRAEQRCHITLRQPPSDSACLFCSTNFSGRGSWEARIEHVAKHMEQYKKEGNEVPEPESWRADCALEQWLVSEGVISKVRQRWSVV